MKTTEVNIVLYSKKFLESRTTNRKIISDIEDFVYEWKFNSQYDLMQIAKDLDVLVGKLLETFFKNDDHVDVIKSLHCVVHQIILDTFMPIIRAKYNEEDKHIYERSLKLYKTNKLPMAVDKSYYSVPYTAAIVELSMWNSFESPLEKLNCLCNTYDIIFAEFKTAMINVISKYSDKEIDLPIIDNKDVLPIMVIVLLKSKLRYTYSNLYYIKIFAAEFIDHNHKYVLQTFEQALETILNTENSLDSNVNHQTNIDFREAIENITKENIGQSTSFSSKINIENENKRRLMHLIIQSTTSI